MYISTENVKNLKEKNISNISGTTQDTMSKDSRFFYRHDTFLMSYLFPTTLSLLAIFFYGHTNSEYAIIFQKRICTVQGAEPYFIQFQYLSVVSSLYLTKDKLGVCVMQEWKHEKPAVIAAAPAAKNRGWLWNV